MGDGLRGIIRGIVHLFSGSLEIRFHFIDFPCSNANFVYILNPHIILSTTATTDTKALRLDNGIDSRKGTGRIIPLHGIELGHQPSYRILIRRRGCRRLSPSNGILIHHVLVQR